MRNSSSLSPLAPFRSHILAKTLTEGFALSRPRRSSSSESLERRIEQALKSEFYGGIASELSKRTEMQLPYPYHRERCRATYATRCRGKRGPIFHATYATRVFAGNGGRFSMLPLLHGPCSTCSTPNRGPRGSWPGCAMLHV